MSLPIQRPLTVEQNIQQTTDFYTQKGMLDSLRRQWQFINEPEQKDFLIRSILLTVGAVTYCTHKGLQIGAKIAENFSLKDEKKQIVIICGGGGGFLTGVGLGVTGNACLIENSQRINEWKQVRFNERAMPLLQQEFENDPILAQFNCPISQCPMFFPVRTPGGPAFDYNSLIEAADANGMIRDIYNKAVPVPAQHNANSTVVISYSIDACLADAEMTIVVYKRFKFLIAQKCQESKFTPEAARFFVIFKNAISDFAKVLYIQEQDKINKKRREVVMKEGVTEEETEKAEDVYLKESETYRQLFGKTALSDIDWGAERDWAEILNKRWMAENHG